MRDEGCTGGDFSVIAIFPEKTLWKEQKVPSFFAKSRLAEKVLSFREILYPENCNLTSVFCHGICFVKCCGKGKLFDNLPCAIY